MTSLDLRKAPPRPPRADLAGLVFLPRSIDKVRATLPGGHLGEYNVEGFTEKMLEAIGISVAQLTEVIATCAGDDDVAAYVGKHARPGGVEAWNAYVLHRAPFNGDRAAAIAEIPWLAEHPDIRFSLDLLAEDDRRTFAKG